MTLFTESRAAAGLSDAVNLNPRQIVFICPPYVKNDRQVIRRSGVEIPRYGQYYDPWGIRYVIRIDGNYDNQLLIRTRAECWADNACN